MSENEPDITPVSISRERYNELLQIEDRHDNLVCVARKLISFRHKTAGAWEIPHELKRALSQLDGIIQKEPKSD